MVYLPANNSESYNAAATLFREYAIWLGIDLSFQHFEEELQQLNSMYAPPAGGIILCKYEEKYVGCVGIRKLDEATAEMKRMYVQPAFQGKGIAGELLLRSLKLAKYCGYESVRLDTLSTMTPAMNLYRKFGFEETEAYYFNPNETVVYFQKFL